MHILNRLCGQDGSQICDFDSFLVQDNHLGVFHPHFKLGVFQHAFFEGPAPHRAFFTFQDALARLSCDFCLCGGGAVSYMRRVWVVDVGTSHV